jgi:hypothetical protein
MMPERSLSKDFTQEVEMCELDVPNTKINLFVENVLSRRKKGAV